MFDATDAFANWETSGDVELLLLETRESNRYL